NRLKVCENCGSFFFLSCSHGWIPPRAKPMRLQCCAAMIRLLTIGFEDTAEWTLALKSAMRYVQLARALLHSPGTLPAPRPYRSSTMRFARRINQSMLGSSRESQYKKVKSSES